VEAALLFQPLLADFLKTVPQKLLGCLLDQDESILNENVDEVAGYEDDEGTGASLL